MRVKLLTAKSFRATTSYVLGATKNQKPQVLFFRGIELNHDDATAVSHGEMTRKEIRKIAKYIGYSFDLQSMCHPLEKPVRHYIITFPPSDFDKLRDNARLTEIVKDYMKEVGIVDTQYLAVRHNNTAHPHVHLIFNPINDLGEIISESEQFKKNEKVCKMLTNKYGLNFSNPREFRCQDIKKIRTDEQPKVAMRHIIEQILDKSVDIRSLQSGLEKNKILMNVHKDKIGNVRGLSFHYEDIRRNLSYHFKASQLSRSLSFTNIMKYFDFKRKLRIKETYHNFCKAELKIKGKKL